MHFSRIETISHQTGGTPKCQSGGEEKDLDTVDSNFAPYQTSPHPSLADMALAFFDFGAVSDWYQDPANDFNFLLRFTDDKGLPTSFQSDTIIKTLSYRLLFDFSVLTPGTQLWDDVLLSNFDFVPSDADTDELYCNITDRYFETSDLNDQALIVHAPQLSDTRALTRWPSDRLQLKTEAIIASLLQTSALQRSPKTSNSCSSSEIEIRCRLFFSPSNIRRFLTVYFEVWHPNCPIVHKATFNPLDAQPCLLAAILVLGACHSPDVEDRTIARMWFDGVEELVFAQFGSGPYPPTWDEGRKHHTIRLLQAAYAVCIYQNWDGDKIARWRVRHQRFPTMVSVVRSLDVSSARHRDYLSPHKPFDWSDFVQAEETLRTILWIFLLDTAFVIFHQMPPRMLVREMECDLALPEPCFQAETAQECEQKIQAWLPTTRRHSRPRSFCELVKLYCEKEMDPGMQNSLANEAFMNHWAVIGAMHVVLFNTEASGLATATSAQVRSGEVGLVNWKAIWNHIALCGSVDFPSSFALLQDQDEVDGERELWKRPGFWRHASEYWLLLRVMVDRIVARKGDGARAGEAAGLFGEKGVYVTYADKGMRASVSTGEMGHLKNLMENFQRLKVSVA